MSAKHHLVNTYEVKAGVIAGKTVIHTWVPWVWAYNKGAV